MARQLTQSGFAGKIVIVTTFGRPGYLRAAMAAGASGFLLKDAPAEQLVGAVRSRPPGTPVVDVFRVHTLTFWKRLEATGMPQHEFWAIVESSSALRDYAEATFARLACSVAHVLAAERAVPEDDPGSHALARVLCGVNAAILTCGLHRIARGDEAVEVAREMKVAADRAYGLVDGVGGGR